MIYIYDFLTSMLWKRISKNEDFVNSPWELFAIYMTQAIRKNIIVHIGLIIIPDIDDSIRFVCYFGSDNLTPSKTSEIARTLSFPFTRARIV